MLAWALSTSISSASVPTSYIATASVEARASPPFFKATTPNPHYVPELRPLTGRDTAVAEYLAAQPDAIVMLERISAFLRRWLPAFKADQRAYLTVAIGCTGGQHRSVWFAERLAERFGKEAAPLVRHRELDPA